MFRVLGIYNLGPHPEIPGFILAFPTGWDSATFRDKGTEVLSLSWDKGTTGQAQNLAKGWDRPGEPVKIWDRTQAGMVPDFDSLSLPVLWDKTVQSRKVLKQEKDVLKQERMVLNRGNRKFFSAI